MARKKSKTEVPEAPVVEPAVDTPVRNIAELFARQRRISVLSSADGEQLKVLLEKAGVKMQKRVGAGYEMISFNLARFVIDTTK